MTVVVVSIACQLEISYTAVAAGKADRPLPISKTRPHPAFRIQRDTGDRECQRWDRDLPGGRDLAIPDLGPRFRRHRDIGRGDLAGLAIGQYPVGGGEIPTVG